MSSSPRAYSYVRFSTPEQLKGDSLRRQMDLSVQYARDHGLSLDEHLTFRDLGVSAYDKSNVGAGGKLREFLDAVEQGYVPAGSFLLVESLERLSRARIRDALRIFLSILDKGITIVTLSDGMTYSPRSDDTSQDFTSLVVSLAIMSRAHEESLTKSRRLKAAWTAKREGLGRRKLTGLCPAWLRLSADKTAYEFVPERLAVVRRIIDLVRSGVGKGAIAKRLNVAGIPSIGQRNRKRVKGSDVSDTAQRSKNLTWFGSYVSKIVKSRALIGEFKPHRMEGGKRVPAGEPVADYFPRVLSDEEFALLQELVSERGRRSGGTRGRSFSNLFTGLAKCGYCGSSMVYVDKGEDRRGHRDNRKNRFLVCHAAKRGAGCHHVPWVYADFEDAFFSFAKRTDFERFVKSINGSATQLPSLNDEIVVQRAKQDELTKRRDRLVDAIATGGAQPRALVEKIIQLETDLAGCEERLRVLDNAVNAASTRQRLSDDALEALRVVTIELRTTEGDELFLLRAKLNEHLRRVVERLTLFPGGTIHTADEVIRIRTELSAASRYSQEEIERFAATQLRTTPHKRDRYFVIRNRHQGTQVVHPDDAVPDIFALMEDYPKVWPELVRMIRANAEESPPSRGALPPRGTSDSERGAAEPAKSPA